MTEIEWNRQRYERRLIQSGLDPMMSSSTVREDDGAFTMQRLGILPRRTSEVYEEERGQVPLAKHAQLNFLRIPRHQVIKMNTCARQTDAYAVFLCSCEEVMRSLLCDGS